MKDIIKGLWKWILAILIILILGLVILAFRIFVIDKNFDGTAESVSKNKNKTSVTNEAYSDGKGKSKDSSSNGGSSSGENSNGNVNGNSSEGLSSNPNENATDNSSTLKKLGKKVENGVKTVANATVRGYKEDEEEYIYNSLNFDESFLMYEGFQTQREVKVVLERLIENANDDFYDRTAVTAVNFANNTFVKYNGNIEEYQNNIRNIENQVIDGNYEISFNYGKLKSYANEIVITKK